MEEVARYMKQALHGLNKVCGRPTFPGVPHMRSTQVRDHVREVIIGRNFKTVTNGVQG